jgi:hypothetical protein
MPSNHHAWQPSLTNHSASAKIKVTTSDLTRGWEQKSDYFSNRSIIKRQILHKHKIKRLSSQKKSRVTRGVKQILVV